MSTSLGIKPTTLGWQRREWRGPSPSRCCQAVQLEDHGAARPLELWLFEIISPLICKPLWADIPVPLSKKHPHWYTGLQRGSLERGFNRREWKEVSGREGVLSYSRELAHLSCPDLARGHPSGQCFLTSNPGHLFFKGRAPWAQNTQGLRQLRLGSIFRWIISL